MEGQKHQAENGGGSGSCKISVIIPVFNIEKYLQRCVDSVVYQTFRDFELILVDDCSTDGSPAICDEYARKDSRVKVIHNAQNQGSSKARKTGLDAASGDYVLFVDSDDWTESDMLEAMYEKAASDGLDMVYCGLYRNTETEQLESDSPFLDDKTEMIKEIAAWKRFSPAVWNKLVKRAVYQKVKFPYANYGEDRQIIVQAIYYADKIGYTKKCLYHYYVNETSLCNSDGKSRILKRYCDSAEIMIWTINFLNNNCNIDFSMAEPELSISINSIKLHFALEKPIRKFSVFHELYPASNRYIFSSTWREFLANKIILFLSVHDRTFILADIFSAAHHAVRTVYKMLVPKNVRNVIWHKWNKNADI
jgi:glycosyltransferase involved in cell wall biosynthesis